MENEFNLFPKVILNNNILETRLNIKFTKNGNCIMILEHSEFLYTIVERGYCEAMKGLLIQFPHGTTLHFQNNVMAQSNGKRKVVEINELITLQYDEFEEENVLEFKLFTSNEEGNYVTNSREDFGIALLKLVKSFNFTLEICASCSKSDFKSNGSEDLRHGWYCFRDLDFQKLKDPWFEREELFELAIANVSAFYWCPSYIMSKKLFA